MKRSRLLIGLAMLFCAAIALGSALPASLAYMAASSGALRNSFSAVYLPPQDLSVPVRIQKSMVNLTGEKIGPGGFQFQLIHEKTGETAAATSADDGSAQINLTFTAEDVGKTHRYRLQELNDGRAHVIYDDRVYDISISLVLNEIHEMSAHLTVNGQSVNGIAAEFVNQVHAAAPVPDTGDHAQPLLWLALLILSTAGLAARKKKWLLSGGRSE